MKKILPVTLPLLLLILTACSGVSDNAVIFNGVTYRTDFYEDLYVLNLNRSKEPIVINNKNFYQVENIGYNLLITYPGGINGELYCPEADWEDAKNYCENPDNFIYYCKRDGKDNLENKFELETIDVSKFNELMNFVKNNSYVPFNSQHNNSVNTFRMPIPESREYTFYKQSKDNIFASSQENKFLISDGKLVLLFYYDHHFGEAEPECVYVNVPEDLSNYFISLISNFSD